MTIRFLTYNIHKGIGTDRKFKPDRILNILQESKADIICLQEVDKDVPRSQYLDITKYLATELGFHYVFEGNVKLKKGVYGNATLTRFPILSSENLDITWKIKKKRGALITRVETSKNHVITVYNYHLGLATFERNWQIHKILTSAIHKKYRDSPSVILGDSNDRRHKLNPLMEIAGYKDSCITKLKRKNFTFPSYAPVIRIDKVFFNDYWIDPQHIVVQNKVTRIASDHSPVMVDLKLLPTDESLNEYM